MRGPGLRLKCDVRRIWRCPACGSELPAGGHVTSLRCQCEKPPPFMQLVEPRRWVRPEPEPLDVYFECAPDDEEETIAAADSEPGDPVSGDELAAVSTDEPVQSLDDIADDHELGTTDEPDELTLEPETIEEEPPRETAAEAARPVEQASPTGESGEPGRKRKRRSRGGRRKRGRRHGSDRGTRTGPENRSGGPES